MVSPLATYLAIAPKTPEESVLRLLVELGVEVVGGDEGSLLVHDEKKHELVFAMVVGRSAPRLLGQRVPIGEGLTGLAALTREVQIGAPTYRGVEQEAGGPEAVIAAPMLVGDSVVGVITAVSFRQGKRFAAADAEIYARIASVAGILVEQGRRLAALEAGAGGAVEGLGEEAEIERRLTRSLSRIARARPEIMARVVRIVEDIEALVGVEG